MWVRKTITLIIQVFLVVIRWFLWFVFIWFWFGRKFFGEKWKKYPISIFSPTPLRLGVGVLA